MSSQPGDENPGGTLSPNRMRDMPEIKGKLLESCLMFPADKSIVDEVYPTKKSAETAGEWFDRTL